jgi:hypothetical protein
MAVKFRSNVPSATLASLVVIVAFGAVGLTALGERRALAST